jgi:hypothetical protein
LARPPETVAVKEVLDIVGDSAALAIDHVGPANQILLQRDHAVRKALEGTNLRSLIEENSATIVRLPHSESIPASR